MQLKHTMALLATGWLLVLGSVFFQRAEAETLYTDRIVAVVQGRVITLSMIMRHTAEMEVEMARRLPEHEFQARAKALRRDALDQLIDLELLKAEAKDREFQLPEAAVDQQISQIVRRETGGDRSEFEDMLTADGMTWTEFREQVRMQILIDALLDAEVRSQYHVSPAEVRRFYDNNQEEFVRPEEILVQRIFIDRENRSPEALQQIMEELLGRLRRGVDFELTGLDFTDDEQVLDSTWLKFEDLPRPMAAMAQRLPAGAVSPPISTQEGVWLMRIQRKQGEVLQDFSQVRDEIIEILSQEHRQKRYDQLIDSLHRKFHVRIHDPEP